MSNRHSLPFACDPLGQAQNSIPDLSIPLSNLSTIQATMDSVGNFLSQSINANTVVANSQMEIVSSEISTAIHQILVNGVAILDNLQSSQLKSSNMEDYKSTHTNNPLHSFPDPEISITQPDDPKTELEEDLVDVGNDCGIMEIDAIELLAEHKHFCDVCGKGFKRDANLRMHMRAHGSHFKTPEALRKPETIAIADTTRFSCPHDGCSRNRKHSKFRSLKSVICLRNHFKRSHCPKILWCNRCNKKSFSVMADLKSHLKHCGEIKWKCSCGTTFSRKDKLFGHMTLFEGHMPAVADEDAKWEGVVVPTEDKEQERGMNCSDNEFFDGLVDGIGSLEGYSLQDMFGC